MRDFHPAPTVIVGVDGSPAALDAAVWAAGEAAGRDLPLKLVFVIQADLADGDGGAGQLAAAHAALSDAHRAVEATATTVKVESEVLWGNPLATLIELSRSAAMVCVGAIGTEHACHRAGSTAAALAGSAGCPVAVIRRSEDAQRADSGYIVAQVDASPDNWPDNNAVLGWAMAEAKLRGAPLRAISCESQTDGGDFSRARAQLDRRIEHWRRRFPEVTVESVMVPGDIAEYLADNTGSTRLFVSGTRDRRSLGRPGDTSGCSVVTVAGTRP